MEASQGKIKQSSCEQWRKRRKIVCMGDIGKKMSLSCVRARKGGGEKVRGRLALRRWSNDSIESWKLESCRGEISLDPVVQEDIEKELLFK